MRRPLRLGLVGLGKIARDQHLPAIAAHADIELVAVATRNARDEAFPIYHDIEAMLAAEDIDAVVMCQPPQARFEAARAALLAGKHVFLEKPPGATLSEVEALHSLAEQRAVTLFASWHSREAAGVAVARDWLASRDIQSISIKWKEDVRVWHPGQSWIWEPGGFGVFDPGINALSILTAAITDPVRLVRAELETPGNRHAPVAARLALVTTGGIPIDAEFDFLQTGRQSWDIAFETSQGSALLADGGNRWFVNNNEQCLPPEQEYPALYRRFADLVQCGERDVDLTPLRLVADAFLTGHNRIVEDFED